MKTPQDIKSEAVGLSETTTVNRHFRSKQVEVTNEVRLIIIDKLIH